MLLSLNYYFFFFGAVRKPIRPEYSS